MQRIYRQSPASSLLAAVVALAALATQTGCTSDVATSRAAADRPKQPEYAEAFAAAQLTPVRMGKPVELNGCTVELFYIDVKIPDYSNERGVTMATTRCATGTTVATSRECGDGCKSQVISVAPTGAAPAQLSVGQSKEQQIAALEARPKQLKAEGR